METLVRGLITDMMAEAVAPRKRRFGAKAPSVDEIMLSADVMGQVPVDVLKPMLVDIDIGVSTYFDKLASDARSADDAARERIARTVAMTGDVLRDLADGDLSSRITADFDGKFQQIKNDTNAVVDKLATIVGRLQTTSRALKSATGEILSGANDLADRTTR